LSRALKALREQRSVLDDCIEVNRLENEAEYGRARPCGKAF